MSFAPARASMALILFKRKHKKEARNFPLPANKSSERLRFEQSEKRFTAQRW